MHYIIHCKFVQTLTELEESLIEHKRGLYYKSVVHDLAMDFSQCQSMGIDDRTLKYRYGK